MTVNIAYATSRGGHIVKSFPSMLNGGGQEIERLYARRTAAIAKNEAGKVVGEVWVEDPIGFGGRRKWRWFWDEQA